MNPCSRTTNCSKKLLRLFFRDFMELFFPQVAALIDFTSVRYLEQKVFTTCPDGDPRRADSVIEVRTLDGTPEVVVFHVETKV